jgi:hypothetical protein
MKKEITRTMRAFAIELVIYIMGDLTRSILNRANVPVLVARAGPPKAGRTLWKAFKGLFGAR